MTPQEPQYDRISWVGMLMAIFASLALVAACIYALAMTSGCGPTKIQVGPTSQPAVLAQLQADAALLKKQVQQQSGDQSATNGTWGFTIGNVNIDGGVVVTVAMFAAGVTVIICLVWLVRALRWTGGKLRDRAKRKRLC